MTTQDPRSILASVLDAAVAVLCVPAAILLHGVRRYGVERLPITRRVFGAFGVFPVRDHYYEPLFHPRHLRKPLNAERALSGINFNVPEQLLLLDQFRHADELVNMRLETPAASGTAFCIENPMFSRGDAEFLYQFIRHTKPKRVFEIGSGNSTKIAKAALKRNAAESGVAARHVCIEPYEMPWLEELGVELLRKRVEDCPLEFFDELEAGDLLFIDSSHIIRPQGDVLHEYLEIFPRLKPGVYIHIHDIFTPRDYPDRWIREKVLFWNEQYLLETILSNTTQYAVVAALNQLRHHHFNALHRVCPYLNADCEPGSFYVRKLGPAAAAVPLLDRSASQQVA